VAGPRGFGVILGAEITMRPKGASPTTLFCTVLVLAGAGRARALDSRSSDTEIRRFALADVHRVGARPHEYFLTPPPGDCMATAPDLEAARALVEAARTRFHGNEHDVATGPIEEDLRGFRVPFPGGGPYPAYWILRSDFYRCLANQRQRQSVPLVAGYLARRTVEDVTWLAHAFWAERFVVGGSRLLEERVVEADGTISVERMTTVYDSSSWSGPGDIEVRRWRLSVDTSDGAVILDDRLDRRVPLACPPPAPAFASRSGSVRFVTSFERRLPQEGGGAAPMLTLRLVNEGDEVLLGSLSTECPPSSFRLYDETGRDVTPNPGYVCIPEPPRYRIEPGASEVVGAFEWPPRVPSGAPPLPGGTYTVKGTLPTWSCGSTAYPPMVSEAVRATIPLQN
jgi:hypothetical protein